MSWKLKYIKIRNFKFFQKEFTLQPNGKNVILYGENGAGKSSIYWSLYTHFQAITKTEDQAKKYFLPHHPENLRNRCSDIDEKSYVSLCFEDGRGTENILTDGNETCYISNPLSKEFMNATAFGSDFLNYKFLSSLFDFKNSEENEVFDIFMKQILPFLSFTETRFNLDGSDSHDSNAANWLDWLSREIANLPKYDHKKHTIDQRTKECKIFNRQLDSFNRLLKNEINSIISEANLRLRDKFHVDVIIHPVYYPASLQYNNDGALNFPKLLLHAEMTGNNVINRAHISHPKSFFNEAKITSMALAIRLAIINQRSPLDQGGGILVFDDLLISLDMSLRQIVLPMILEHAKQHQLFILTHDRSIFNMVRQFVIRKEGTKNSAGDPDDYGIWDKDWYACEMFVKESEDGGTESFFSEKKDYLDRARAHFHSFRVPECANALRQCCEAKLKELLGINYQYAIDRTTGELTDPSLANFISEFDKERKNKNFPDLFPSIDGDRQRILNPFSHDDIDTPYYMGELRKALDTMENLSKVKKRMPVPISRVGNPLNTYSFDLRTTTDAGEEHFAMAKFCFLENFSVWEYEGKNYPGNPKVKVIWTSESSKMKRLKGMSKQVLPLNQLYQACYKSVSLNAVTAISVLDQLIDDTTHRIIEL